MSDPILAAIDGLRSDFGNLRIELTGRMDQMVTQREHQAEVKRLDAESERDRVAAIAEHAAIRKELEEHRKEADKQTEAVHERMSSHVRVAVWVAGVFVTILSAVLLVVLPHLRWG